MDDAELRELLAAQSREIASLAARLTPPLVTTTVSELYKIYEAAKRATRGWEVIGGALRSIRDTVYSTGLPPLGEREVMSLRPHDWSDYRAFKQAEEWKPGRRRSDWTMRVQLDRLKTMLNWAVREGRIPHNPLAHVVLKAKSRREVAPVESEIQRQLMEADPRMRFVVLASADAGMRRNEIRLCERSWVDVRVKRIRLSAEACKGGKARTVPATQRLLDAIDAIPAHVRAPWILTNPATERPYCPDGFSRWFRELADAAGLRGYRLHDNRHGAATNAVERGAKVTAVQAMLGHEHLSTTLLYVNSSRRDQEPALEQALAAIESGIPRPRR